MSWSLEIINGFAHEELGYKSHIKVIGYDMIKQQRPNSLLPNKITYTDWVILHFWDTGLQETIRRSKIDEWIKKKRDSKLKELGI